MGKKGYIGNEPTNVPLTTSDLVDGIITEAKLNTSAITGQTEDTSPATDDFVLTYDTSATALKKVQRNNFTDGSFRTMSVYTGTGANTWTKPTGLKRVKVTVIAGGGAGGNVGGAGGGQVAVGGGGGAGGIAIKVIAAGSLGATETATVGAAGSSSSFGSHCSATAGSVGGSGGVGATSSAPGGAGGVGSSGDLNIRGGAGMPGYAVAATPDVMSGTGGSTLYGGGGLGVVAGTGGGNSGGGYGAGGSGAVSYNGSGAANGGGGASGVIIVEEFF